MTFGPNLTRVMPFMNDDLINFIHLLTVCREYERRHEEESDEAVTDEVTDQETEKVSAEVTIEQAPAVIPCRVNVGNKQNCIVKVSNENVETLPLGSHSVTNTTAKRKREDFVSDHRKKSRETNAQSNQDDTDEH